MGPASIDPNEPNLAIAIIQTTLSKPNCYSYEGGIPRLCKDINTPSPIHRHNHRIRTLQHGYVKHTIQMILQQLFLLDTYESLSRRPSPTHLLALFPRPLPFNRDTQRRRDLPKRQLKVVPFWTGVGGPVGIRTSAAVPPTPTPKQQTTTPPLINPKTSPCDLPPQK
jgi:hypothetical protein